MGKIWGEPVLTERNEPKEGIVAKNGAEIAAEPTVVGLFGVEGAIIVSALFTELNRCELAWYEIDMEWHEGCDYEGKDGSQDKCGHYEIGNFVIEGIGVAESTSNNGVACGNNRDAGQRTME